jgi:hypothetical protein
MAQVVPLQSVPDQTTQVILGGQNCQLNVYQSPDALFMDVLVNDTPVVTARICENLNRIIRYAYLGFIGDLAFNDTQGTSDPSYTGLGERFQLLYLSTAEASNNL